MQVWLATVGLFTFWSCFLPTTLPELVVGYIYGLWQGWALNYLVKFLSSVISYGLALSVLRGCLHDAFGKHELLCAFEDEVKEKPYWTAFLIRVAYAPMAVKNYGMALIGVPPAAFFTIFFPVELMDSYLLIAVGAGAHDLQELLSGHSSDEDQQRAWLQLGLLCVQVSVLVVLVVHLGRLASQALERRRCRLAGVAAKTEDGQNAAASRADGANVLV